MCGSGTCPLMMTAVPCSPFSPLFFGHCWDAGHEADSKQQRNVEPLPGPSTDVACLQIMMNTWVSHNSSPLLYAVHVHTFLRLLRMQAAAAL